MATLTLRRFKKYFVIVAPDNKILKFKSAVRRKTGACSIIEAP